MLNFVQFAMDDFRKRSLTKQILCVHSGSFLRWPRSKKHTHAEFTIIHAQTFNVFTRNLNLHAHKSTLLTRKSFLYTFKSIRAHAVSQGNYVHTQLSICAHTNKIYSHGSYVHTQLSLCVHTQTIYVHTQLSICTHMQSENAHT